MARHETHVRMESRAGMLRPDYRAMCDCGWEDKAMSREAAEDLASFHVARVLSIGHS